MLLLRQLVAHSYYFGTLMPLGEVGVHSITKSRTPSHRTLVDCSMSKLKAFMPPSELSPVVTWFLSGDKYLHENSLNKANAHMWVGALLYVCVFILNEFIWRFFPYTGTQTFKFWIGLPSIVFLGAFVMVIITRRLLFGENTTRPAPAIGLPNRTTPRLDYQNVIPPYGENKWLIKRLTVYLDLQCTWIMIEVVGWNLSVAISIPYYLLQK